MSNEQQSSSLQMRVHIVREIIQSERTYCAALANAETYFSDLLKQHRVLSDQQHVFLFNTLRVIKNESTVLADELQRLFDENGSTLLAPDSLEVDVGYLLCGSSISFTNYASYVARYDEYQQTIEYAIKTDRAFATNLEEAEARLATINSIGRSLPPFITREKLGLSTSNSQVSSQSSLMSLLISPVQHLPRYVLLLKDLLKNSDLPSDSNGRLLLTQAVDQMTVISLSLNESKRTANNQIRNQREKLSELGLHALVSPARTVLQITYGISCFASKSQKSLAPKLQSIGLGSKGVPAREELQSPEDGGGPALKTPSALHRLSTQIASHQSNIVNQLSSLSLRGSILKQLRPKSISPEGTGTSHSRLILCNDLIVIDHCDSSISKKPFVFFLDSTEVRVEFVNGFPMICLESMFEHSSPNCRQEQRHAAKFGIVRIRFLIDENCESHYQEIMSATEDLIASKYNASLAERRRVEDVDTESIVESRRNRRR